MKQNKIVLLDRRPTRQIRLLKDILYNKIVLFEPFISYPAKKGQNFPITATRGSIYKVTVCLSENLKKMRRITNL